MVSLSSKSVARSAGLRSIRRGRQVAAVSVGSARIPPTGRPVRSGLARWFRLYQFSSFRSVRSFVACSGSLAVPFVPVRFRSFVRLVSRSVSFRFALLLLRLVQSRSVLVQVSFVSVSVLLSLFCARAFSRAGLFILFSRILYTKRGQRQMNFLSKNMSFLIISVSSLNYPTLEHFSPLHFASNRPSCNPRDPTSPSPSVPCKKKTLTQTPPALSIAIAVRAPRQPFQSSAASLPRSEATPGELEGSHKTPFPTLQHHLENKKKHTLTQAVTLLATLRSQTSTPPASRKKTFYLPAIRALRSPPHHRLSGKCASTPPLAPRGYQACRALRVFQGAKRPPESQTKQDKSLALSNKLGHSRFAVAKKRVEPTGRAYQGAQRPQRSGKSHQSLPSCFISTTQKLPPFAPRGYQQVEPTGRAYQGAPAPPAKRQAITYPCRLVSTQQFPNSSRSRLAVGRQHVPTLASRGQSSRVTACRPNSPGFARPNYQHRDRHVVPPSRQPSRQASQQVPRQTGAPSLPSCFSRRKTPVHFI